MSPCPRPDVARNLASRFAAWCVVLSTLFSFPLQAAEKDPNRYEDKEVLVRLVSRTPEQLSAFYIGRGFDNASVEEIRQTCFITVLIKNRKVDVLWLELDNWSFTVDGKPVQRLKRDYWKARWDESGLPQNHQSTFGWTLLPEVRDLRRDESVGGNVTIPAQLSPFRLSMIFKTGASKNGMVKKVDFNNVRCAGR